MEAKQLSMQLQYPGLPGYLGHIGVPGVKAYHIYLKTRPLQQAASTEDNGVTSTVKND